jgi:hypothetical protein
MMSAVKLISTDSTDTGPGPRRNLNLNFRYRKGSDCKLIIRVAGCQLQTRPRIVSRESQYEKYNIYLIGLNRLMAVFVY